MGLFGSRFKVREGSEVQLRQNGVAMCSGTVVHVYGKGLIEVEIQWTHTSVFEKGFSYQVDLSPGNWRVV